MACISPPGPADTDLLAYLDGELDDQVAAHLEQCPHCRVRAQGLARLQDQLTTRLYRFDCPSPGELGEYYLGLVSPDRAAGMADHIAMCPHCAGEVAQLESYLAELRPDLELGLLDQAKTRIRVLVARVADAGAGVALLGQPASAFAGVRGDEGEPLIYEADGVQVVIEIHQDPDQPDHRSILGLVIGIDDPEELRVQIWQDDQRIVTVSVDATGNFLIPNFTSGRYELILSGPESEVHIQHFEVGTSRDQPGLRKT